MDFEGNIEWEYVMLTEEDQRDDEGEDDDDEDALSDKEEDLRDILDMPPPWSPKLFIDRDKYLNLCPNGEKTVFYKKCRIDTYARNRQVDGLIKKITLFKDYKCLIIQEVRMYFANRMDKLWLWIRYPFEYKLVEYYDSDEKYHYWKKMVLIEGEERIIYFYHHWNRNGDEQKNKDGLIFRREIIGKKTIEKYKNWEDRLVYRSVEFTKESEDEEEKAKERN